MGGNVNASEGIYRYVAINVRDLTCCGRRLYTIGGATVRHLAILLGCKVSVALQSMLATMPMKFVKWSTFSDRQHAANI
jgi:hypothetical protein